MPETVRVFGIGQSCVHPVNSGDQRQRQHYGGKNGENFHHIVRFVCRNGKMNVKKTADQFTIIFRQDRKSATDDRERRGKTAEYFPVSAEIHRAKGGIKHRAGAKKFFSDGRRCGADPLFLQEFGCCPSSS